MKNPTLSNHSLEIIGPSDESLIDRITAEQTKRLAIVLCKSSLSQQAFASLILKFNQLQMFDATIWFLSSWAILVAMHFLSIYKTLQIDCE
jgi:hypothetical protein